MTFQASRLLDTVDEMLLDAGQAQDTGLRAALLSLGSLASVPAPAPNAQLAALLGSRPDELSRRRRLRGHRPTIVSLAVVTGMGLGVTGVAASASGPAEKASVSVQQLLEDWAPSWSVGELPLALPTGHLLEPEQGTPSGQSAGADSGAARGQQEPPASKVPGHVAAADKALAAPGHAGTGDGGADAGHKPGSTGAGTEPADAEAKVPAEAGKLPDANEAAAKAEGTARQALEKSGMLLSGVVPENVVPENAVPENAGSPEPGHGSAKKSGAVNKRDPGATWLKKFSH